MYDVNEIKTQFKKVIAYSQNISNPDVDDLFEKWLENKRDIIEAFGGKLIVEVPQTVHFHLDDRARAASFNSFVSDVNNVYRNYKLVEFLNKNSETFFDNIVQQTYEQEDIKIPKGMKLVKAFKFFEKDESILNTLQIQASQIIQEDRVEGTLCFSVHPLDFLSTSENTYNWRSCHALDGEFRAGNLSYMSDKSTIVCYLRGADGVRLNNFPYDVPWNSKKWRVLLYLSQNWDMIFASKQYPFSSRAGLDIVLEHLLPRLGTSFDVFSRWKNDYCTSFTCEDGREIHFNSPYLPIRYKLVALDEIVKDGEHALQFNDLLQSSTYKKPFYSIKDGFYWWESEKMPSFTIGSSVKCLCCGGDRISDSELMVCRSCAEDLGLYDDESCVCDCCGARVYEDEYYYVQGEVVCDRCFHKECFVCASCDEYYFKDDRVYDRDNDEYVCCHCYNSRQRRDD
jgi:hypothetical protein